MPLGKLGKYERVDVLGHGASGIVYLAWDTLLKKQVALKEIDLQSADVGRFLEEARVMDRLSHPNIVRVNGVDKIDGHVLIDMEYVKGQNLQQMLRREGRLPILRAIDIAIQTLDALEYAHRMRTVHRDIKPANILVGRDSEVKLVDFGLAEILATNSYAGGAGTYAYMAPEDFSEEHHSDHQSDVWAVGVTLYEMVSGARPFNVAKPKDPFAWRRVLNEERPTRVSEYLPEAPAALQVVLDRALAADKAQRYASAGEFRDALAALRSDPAVAKAAAAEPAPSPAPPLPDATPPAQSDTSSKPEFVLTDPTPGRRGYSGLRPQLAVPTLTQPSAVALDVEAPAAGAQALVAPPRYGGDTAVEQSERRRLGLWRKPALPARIAAAPAQIDFGELRKGDDRSIKLKVQFEGGDGRVSGQVVALPAWATVDPPVIARRRQTLTVTAHSARVWEIGQFDDQIRIESNVGSVVVPVTLRVLKPRRSFAEVMLWFVPALLCALLPAASVAAQIAVPGLRHLAATATLGSGLLAAMLLLVAVEADLGYVERIVCGVLLAAMTMVLGVTLGHAGRAHQVADIMRVPLIGIPFGLVLCTQVLHRRYWKLWTAAVVALGILSTFALTVAGGGQLIN